MITETISGIVADHKAASRPSEEHGPALVPYRRVPDQAAIRHQQHQAALDAAAATHLPDPNVTDPATEAFDWFRAVAARKVHQSPHGLEQTLRGLQRALSAHLVHDHHRQELAAALEWVRYHAAPLQLTSKAGF